MFGSREGEEVAEAEGMKEGGLERWAIRRATGYNFLEKTRVGIDGRVMVLGAGGRGGREALKVWMRRSELVYGRDNEAK